MGTKEGEAGTLRWPAAAPAVGGEDRRSAFDAEALPLLRPLYGTAYRLCRNAADAEDLVQETFLRAYRAVDRYQPGTNIRAWLYTILYRARTDSLRRRGRRPQEVEALPDDDAALSVPPPQEALAFGPEALERALAQVPEPFRAAVILRDVEELTYEEVAQVLEVPLGTVMSRIHRGRAALRRLLKPAGV